MTCRLPPLVLGNEGAGVVEEGGGTDRYGHVDEVAALVAFVAGHIHPAQRAHRSAEEVLVERAKPLRNNAGPDEAAFVNQFNDMMASPK